MPAEAVHWLLKACRKAGFPGADSAHIPRDTKIAEAWATVARACSLSDTEIAEKLAAALGIELADLDQADPSAVKLIPPSLAHQYKIFPLSHDYHQVTLAVCDPFDVEMEQTVRFASGRMPVSQLACPRELDAVIAGHYSPDRAAENLLRSIPADDEDSLEVVSATGPDDVDVNEAQSNPVVKLTNLILLEAVQHGASDIHLQPVANGGVARFRVDGVLRNFMQIPTQVLNRVVSRIKILGDMDITVRMRPQDGRARIRINGISYDLRISTVPTRGAEKAVIRIPSSEGDGGLDQLCMPDTELQQFRQLLTHREGIAVVTGPTGSGKTTTLYAALREIDSDAVNIMTVEDPIEYELPGLTQIQVEPVQGVTFASALKSILRQDPDVIFVGEIRDHETAEIAVQASLTGHFVLATLHTNSAVGAVRRLTDLGLERRAISETLIGSLAQRLVRQVCSHCVETVTDELSHEEQRLMRLLGVRPEVRAVGCSRCGQTGYRGRIPLIEVFTIVPGIDRLIFDGAPAAELTAAGIDAGMRPLAAVALERARAGETTLEEIERVIGNVGADGEESDGDHEGLVPAEKSTETEEANQIRVLVVDDDGANRTIARALLEREGFRVVEATDGEEALAELKRNNHYTLMVLDLDMPRLDGREVLANVRGDFATAGLPVIVLTGSTDENAETQLMDQGADDYIRKPLDPGRFLARVKAALRRVSG